MGKGQPHRLGPDEIKIIEEMTLDGSTDAAIAKRLNRNEQTIARRRKSMGLIKGGRGQLAIDPKTIEKVSINAMSDGDREKIQNWLNFFKASKRYTRLKTMFMPGELEYFGEQWAIFHTQMDDITAAEEDMLELMIMYKIRIDQNQKNLREAQIHEDMLRQKLEGRMDQELDLENDQDRFIFELMMANNRNMHEINKDLKDLVDKYEKIQKALNQTREQRESRQRIGGDTFLSLVREMNDKERRAAAGVYNERMRLATQSQERKLKNVHTFIDGGKEAILLDGADYIEENKDKDG